MVKLLVIFTFQISSLNIYAQFSFDVALKLTPDTLYFPFEDDIQIIIINDFDSYNRIGEWHDAIYPRGGSWLMDNGPAPQNIYLFRDRAGEVIKIFNSDSIHHINLKSVTYFNTDDLSLMDIIDYQNLNNHFRFYEDDKIGLINTKGEIAVAAIYDDIRKYQDKGGNSDKLIIRNGHKFGFLDSNLKVLFPPIYRTKIDTNYRGYPEHNRIDGENIVVFKGDKCGLISEEGEILIDFLFGDIRLIHDGMYMGLIYKDRNEMAHTIKNHWGSGYLVKACTVFNNDFSVITKLEDFEYIYYYGTKRLIVKKDGKFGVLNHLGEEIVPLEYDELMQKDSHYMVQVNNKWGLVSGRGEVMLPLQYEEIDGIFVIQNDLIGICNRHFKLIAEPQFVNKTWEMGKYILTRQNGSRGFIKSRNGESYYQSPEGKIINL
ncbi:MAG: WG repeat-containing protein [Crocinitomicaceae bacterium]